MHEEKAELENEIDAENPFLTTFRKHENIGKLTREVLIDLVEHIKIHGNGDINVKLKFSNEYRRIAEYIRLNIHSNAV